MAQITHAEVFIFIRSDSGTVYKFGNSYFETLAKSQIIEFIRDNHFSEEELNAYIQNMIKFSPNNNCQPRAATAFVPTTTTTTTATTSNTGAGHGVNITNQKKKTIDINETINGQGWDNESDSTIEEFIEIPSIATTTHIGVNGEFIRLPEKEFDMPMVPLIPLDDIMKAVNAVQEARKVNPDVDISTVINPPIVMTHKDLMAKRKRMNNGGSLDTDRDAMQNKMFHRDKR